MRKLIVTEWVSLDGIFDANYMPQWWMPFDSAERQQYIQDTINNSNMMLYGRTTYEMLYPYWSSFAHNEQGVADKLNQGKKYLVSSTLQDAPWNNTEILRGDFIKEIADIKKSSGEYILMQGSSTLLKPLLEAGLVDELKLLVNPAIVGEGKKLFSTPVNCAMELLHSQQFEKNVLQLTYRPLVKLP